MYKGLTLAEFPSRPPQKPIGFKAWERESTVLEAAILARVRKFDWQGDNQSSVALFIWLACLSRSHITHEIDLFSSVSPNFFKNG